MPVKQNPSVRCVLDIKAESGETPVWDTDEQRLYWVDQNAFRLNRFDPVSGHNETWQLPAHISSFALRGPGKPIVAALRTGLHDFDLRTGELNLVSPPPYDAATMRYNDGRCDRQGRYIIGSVDLGYFESRVPGKAAMHRWDKNGLATIVPGITVSNGLAFSPDGRTMYLADTVRFAIVQFDYDTQTGTASNERPFIKLGPSDGKPDGAEVDAEGYYWLALLMRGAVARYAPDGVLDRMIDVPVLQPTKICFGGPDLSTLYMTSAGHRHIPGDEPMGEQAGGVFAIDVGVRGLPEPRYAY